MKFFVLFSVACSVALCAPLEDTEEVKAAKAAFMTAFEAAEKGEHASLAPAPVATAYLDDAPDVAAAKAAFDAQFKAAETLSNYPIYTYSALPNYYHAVAPFAHVAAAPVAYYNYATYNPYFITPTLLAAAPAEMKAEMAAEEAAVKEV